MVHAEDISAWRGQPVIDPDGEQVGKLEDVLFDAGSGTPLLLSVKSGLLGRRTTLIPVEGASVGPDWVRVTYAKQTAEEAGRAQEPVPDAAGLAALGEAYGLRFSERISLESADARDAQRAEAEAARTRAANLEAEAQRKLAAREAAAEDARAAGDNAGQAERDAAEAREAAARARAEADRYGGA